MEEPDSPSPPKKPKVTHNNSTETDNSIGKHVHTPANTDQPTNNNNHESTNDNNKEHSTGAVGLFQNKNWLIDPSELHQGPIVGQGAFGVVKQGKWRGIKVCSI